MAAIVQIGRTHISAAHIATVRSFEREVGDDESFAMRYFVVVGANGQEFTESFDAREAAKSFESHVLQKMRNV